MKYYISILCCLSVQCLFGQNGARSWDTVVTDSPEKRMVHASKMNYLRFGGENDAWVLRQGTDRYYSHGFLIDYFFKKNGFNSPLGHFLFPRVSADADNYWGCMIRTGIYTPDTVQRLRNGIDHPYGGLATIGVTHISKNLNTGTRLTTEYQLGVIGPASRQEQLQKMVHRLTNKSYPVGWEHQIPNDIAFNMRLNYEHPFYNYGSNLEVVGLADANFGTISNNGGIGGRVRIGNFYKSKNRGIPLMDVKFHKKFQYYFSVQGMGYFVGDNAMLQGGVFLDSKRRKQYISVENLERWIAEGILAYHLTYGNMGLTYTYTVRSPSFTGGKSYIYGGLSWHFRFN